MLNFRKLEHTISGSISGKPFNITKTDDAIKFLIDAQTNGLDDSSLWAFIESARLGEIAGSNKYLIFSPVTNEYFLTFDGYRSKKAIPQALVDMIEKSYDKDIDFMPVLKAWARLLANPRYNDQMGKYFATYISTDFTDRKAAEKLMEDQDIAEDIALAMSTYPDISISQEGMLVTYKVADIVDWEYLMKEDEDGNYSKIMKNKYRKIPAVLDTTTGDVLTPETYEKPDHLEDYLFTPSIYKNGDKFYSGQKLGYVYEVGKTQHLPKKAKRNLNNTSGGGGLYSGGLRYIEHFRGVSRQVLVCFVNPGDIISFQSEGHAFRTDALFPNNVWDLDVPLRNTYHSSDYDKLSEERLENLMRDAVDEGIVLSEEQRKYIGDDANTED